MNRPTYDKPPSVAWLLAHAVVCDVCSAVVMDIAEHDRFHERLKHVAEDCGRLLHPQR